MLVEFVGLPGAGKSLLAQKTMKQLNEENWRIRSPTSKINEMNTHTRIPVKLSYTTFSTLTSPQSSFSAVRSAGVSQLKSNRDTRSVLFNWLFVRGLITICRIKNESFVLDQGALQTYWSACLSESTPTCEYIRSEINSLFQNIPILIIDVDASSEILEDRLDARNPNPSRITTENEGYTVDDGRKAYTELQQLINDIKKKNQNVRVRHVSNEVREDIEPIVELIVRELTNMINTDYYS